MSYTYEPPGPLPDFCAARFSELEKAYDQCQALVELPAYSMGYFTRFRGGFGKRLGQRFLRGGLFGDVFLCCLEHTLGDVQSRVGAVPGLLGTFLGVGQSYVALQIGDTLSIGSMQTGPSIFAC